MIDTAKPVADLVSQHPECAEVLQRHRIDFCCRGDVSLEASARARDLALAPLVAQLEVAIASRSAQPPADPRALSTQALVEHVVETHHAFLRRTLPFVRTLSAKVARVHGDHNAKLRPLESAVAELVDSLLPHLDFEERDLFPGLLTRPSSPVVQRQLESMQEDHLEMAAILERIRDASEDFKLPEWACNSYRTLFSELAAIETDLFAHVHLENHVLRPRFVDSPAEQALA